ncbi:PiggyBac transposable element-derived protein 3 [Trichinella patagoniensis]|uniref:PiggyBac transposable element-derived protein 3 n=1 Tax=Trichinella patagoniensis TaxID=990121 RepID=A0A0V0ZKU7_9BILA|nr:PiggyBac transposable element-derived protein 3 [Trichinella patagoniensis]
MGAQVAIRSISRNRFVEIKKYVHMADNQKLMKGDKMSKKWYWPLFVNLVNIATVAAWRIHCFVEETPHSRLEFRRQVVLSLLYSEGTAPGRAASGFMSQWSDIRFGGVNHSLDTGPQGRCKLCQRNTKNMYKKCNVQLNAERGKQCLKFTIAKNTINLP